MRATDDSKLDVLFFLRSPNLDRLYACLLEALVERGHTVTVVVEKDGGGASGAGNVLAELAAEGRGVSLERLPPLPDRWRHVRRRLSVAVDLLRYLEPEFRDADALKARAHERASGGARLLARLLARSASGRRTARRVLLRLHRLVPVSPARRAFVARHEPDLVVIAPLVSIGSPQDDWVRIAALLGVPSVLPVASWDNLSNKGLVKEAPTLTVVWNDTQAAEASELQGIPNRSVVVTGAHSFDHWFGRRPATTREGFAAASGLPDDRPFILYVCSSRFIAGDETAFVGEWLARLRGGAEPRLRDVAVLIRPHPFNAEEWASFDAGDELVSVWPPAGSVPTDAARRSDYFDSLYHASCVVGINTSALVEAAIVHRPSFTLTDERFRAGQAGTLHFGYIAGDLVVVANTWEEHLGQLADALAHPGADDARLERFVERFLRPHGLDRPAAPIAVAALERVA